MGELREFKKYEQLLRVQIGKIRYLVVSKTIDGKISMAQQIKIPDYQGNDQYVFLKNAFIFETMEAFEKFREDLSNIKIEKNQQEGE